MEFGSGVGETVGRMSFCDGDDGDVVVMLVMWW